MFSSLRLLVWPFVKVYLIGIYSLLQERTWKYRRYYRCSPLNTERLSAVVTGGGRGIGLEVAKQFLELGIDVVIVGNDKSVGAVACSVLKERTGRTASFYCVDLACLQSVKECCEAIKRRHKKLNFLINNAGIMMVPYAQSADGIELQWATNVVGSYSLTFQLLSLLKRGASLDSISRIVNVSSSTIRVVSEADFRHCLSVAFGQIGQKLYSPHASYYTSKFAIVLLARRLQALIDADDNVRQGDMLSVSLHPGVVLTGLYDHVNVLVRLALHVASWFFFRSAAEAAQDIVTLCFDVDAVGGTYYENGNRCKFADDLVAKFNMELVQRFWKLLSTYESVHA